jgi:hypothetical protein
MNNILSSIKKGMKYADVIMKLKMSKSNFIPFDLSTDTGEVKAIDVIVSDTPVTLIFDNNNTFCDWS